MKINILNNVQRRAKAMIDNFTAEGKRDKKRLAKAQALVDNDLERAHQGMPTDDGLAGKVAELLSHDSDSTIMRVQKQGAVDLYLIIDGKRVKAEYKTNGGRIENLYNIRRPEATYIVYDLDFKPADRKRKDGSIVVSEPRRACKVMTVASFLNIVEECKAVKIASHAGKNDAERAVQCSSKKLYEALEVMTDYVRNKTYLSANIAEF